MIDTDKYEGMTYNNDYKMGIELEIAVGNLLAEVKRLRQENDELHAQRVQFSWIQEARGGQSDAPLLQGEVKRLREENYKLKRFVENIEWGLKEVKE